jgi:murein DD-endopeptidase MepM/ murein hydrolase activator NlpD
MKFPYALLYLKTAPRQARRLPHLLFFALVIAAAVVGQTTATIHTVRRGETFYSIAQAYGVSADELMRINRITNPRNLIEGKKLTIPVKVSIVEHRAKRGETLFGIARLYGVSVDAIRKTNNLRDSYILKEGDLLRIPQTSNGAANVVNRPSEVQRWPVVARNIEYRSGALGGVILIGGKSEIVRSLSTGTVISAGPYHGFGKVVVIQTEGGYAYVYGGCESLLVKVGDTARPGTELGRLGEGEEQSRLFFLVFRNNKPIDPATAPRM